MNNSTTLITEVKSFLLKIERAKGETEGYEIQAGLRLIELKNEAKRQKIKWPDYLAKNFGEFLHRSWANDLIRKAKGKDVLAEKAKRMKKKREIDRHVTVKSACDLDPEEAEEGEAPEDTRRRACLWRMHEAVRMAEHTVADYQQAIPSEIDEEVLLAAVRAAEAWSATVKFLKHHRHSNLRIVENG